MFELAKKMFLTCWTIMSTACNGSQPYIKAYVRHCDELKVGYNHGSVVEVACRYKQFMGQR